MELLRATFVVWLPLLVVVVVAVVVSVSTDITLRILMQDATTVLNGPFYVGSISVLGILGWSAASAICFFGAVVAEAESPWRRFLVAFGALTAVLVFDDAFLLHDEILPIHLGVPGELFGVLYVAATLALVVRFRTMIATTNYVLMAIALALFAISAVVDVGSTRLSQFIPSAVVELGEDAPKLVGIGTWLAYWASAARQAVARAA